MRRSVITVESHDIFMRKCQKKKKDPTKQGEQNTQMQLIAKVAERSCLDS